MAEFARGGESCAAQADDAAGGDAFAQGVGVAGFGVKRGQRRHGFVFAVAF